MIVFMATMFIVLFVEGLAVAVYGLGVALHEIMKERDRRYEAAFWAKIREKRK